MNIDDFISRLDKVTSTGQQKWKASCPAHPDKYPSLSLRETDDGRILIHCFAGCSVGDIVTAVGLELTDLFPPRIPLEGSQPIRRPFLPSDAQDTLGLELSVVVAGLAKMLDTGLDREDIQRIVLAARRLNGVLETVTGYPNRRLEQARKLQCQ